MIERIYTVATVLAVAYLLTVRGPVDTGQTRQDVDARIARLESDIGRFNADLVAFMQREEAEARKLGIRLDRLEEAPPPWHTGEGAAGDGRELLVAALQAVRDRKGISLERHEIAAFVVLAAACWVFVLWLNPNWLQ